MFGVKKQKNTPKEAAASWHHEDLTDGEFGDPMDCRSAKTIRGRDLHKTMPNRAANNH